MARVLVLGAGGVGCELLKNLVLSDLAHDIVVIDMDTIELSNLNRQFMYQIPDIGRPKADVAVEWVTKRFPHYEDRINGLRMRIEQLPSEFYSSFHVVISCLDSVESRRWINDILVKAGIPLIDTGSEGYSGHVMLVIPGQTACIECLKDLFVGENFALCTLAGFPRSVQHCIQWAAQIAWTREHGNRHVALDDACCLELLLEKAKERAVHHELDSDLISTDTVKQTLDRTVPSLSTTNSVIAGIAVSLADNLLSGQLIDKDSPNFYSYNGQTGAYFNHLCFERDPECSVCNKL